jgi:hypothetical protein
MSTAHINETADALVSRRQHQKTKPPVVMNCNTKLALVSVTKCWHNTYSREYQSL